jgi:hypothetical protein
MDNKDTKSIVGGVESEGAFSSHISSVKGHTSAVVHAPGQNEEFKVDTNNLSSSSSEERVYYKPRQQQQLGGGGCLFSGSTVVFRLST